MTARGQSRARGQALEGHLGSERAASSPGAKRLRSGNCRSVPGADLPHGAGGCFVKTIFHSTRSLSRPHKGLLHRAPADLHPGGPALSYGTCLSKPSGRVWGEEGLSPALESGTRRP